MTNWPICSLGSQVRFLSGGTPSKDESRFWDGEIPWVSSAEMTQRRIDNTALRVTEDGAKEGSRLISKNTVLVVVRGMSLAKEFRVAITKRELTFNQDLKALLPSNNLNPAFLFYYLLSQNKAICDSASEAAHGTKKLDMPVLEQWPLPLPPQNIQKKIAAILSAYDDLIENNQRRIALLEKMAEEIYREWFVRLHFPGHEKVKKIKGVPEGWAVSKISDVVDFLSGFSFESETYTPNGKYGVVTIKNVQDGYFIPECSDFVEDVPSKMKKHCFLEASDVLMSLTGNVGRVCHVYGDNLLLNQRVAKLLPKFSNSSQYLFCLFNNKSMTQLIENLSLGSTAQMNLSPILLGKQKIVIPSDNLLLKFERTIQPMHQEKMLLLQKNKLLAKLRDKLLPRLISGKLSVEHLDIQFPPGMEESVHDI